MPSSARSVTLTVDDPPAASTGTLTAAPNTLNQFEHQRRTANVPAGLDPLRYHGVGTRRLRGSCFLD